MHSRRCFLAKGKVLMASSALTPARIAILLATLAAIALAFAPSWVSMIKIWETTVTYHHGFLVLPIALWLIWRQRQAMRQQSVQFEPLALLPALGFALLWLIGRAGDIQLFEHVAVVGLAVSAAGALLGRHLCGTIAFPLLFLFFMVPFGDVFVPQLQNITAHFAVALLRLSDIPVFHDGFIIETPSGKFEVAEACAGIRFLIANVMVAAIFAHLSYRRVWKWVLFMVLAVIIPIVANGLRAYGIVLIAYWTDNEYAVGVDHLVYGWGFFTVVMLLILFVGNLFADPPAPVQDTRTTALPAATTTSPALLIALAAIILAPPLYARLAMQPPPVSAPSLSAPEITGDWQQALPASAWQPRIANADATATWHYANNAPNQPGIDLAIAYFSHERQGAEVVYHANRMADNEHWTRTSIQRRTTGLSAALPELLGAKLYHERLNNRFGGHRLVWWWYWIDGEFTSDPLRAKLYQLTARLMGRHPPAAIIALSTAYRERPVEAEAAIQHFLATSGLDLAAHMQSLEP